MTAAGWFYAGRHGLRVFCSKYGVSAVYLAVKWVWVTVPGSVWWFCSFGEALVTEVRSRFLFVFRVGLYMIFVHFYEEWVWSGVEVWKAPAKLVRLIYQTQDSFLPQFLYGRGLCRPGDISTWVRCTDSELQRLLWPRCWPVGEGLYTSRQWMDVWREYRWCR